MKWAKWALRSIGLALFVFLLVRYQVLESLLSLDMASAGLLLAAIALNVPQIVLKVVRWRYLLSVQGIRYPQLPATLAYFGSIFIGLLTPGRLGEFIKSVHVQRDCGVSSGRAFSSVLADRLFDLAALFVVGAAAIAALAVSDAGTWIVLLAFAALLTASVALFVHPRGFALLARLAEKLRLGKLFRPEGWLADLHEGLAALPARGVIVAVLLTAAAYAVFYLQCWLVARAAGLPVGPFEVAFAVTLGSLVTLLPISVSGVGTRDAAIVSYLSSAGASGEVALAFSILIFVIFYVGGALFGLIAWTIKPVPLELWKRDRGATRA